MKTISSIGDLLGIKSDLAIYILESCPWISEFWEAENMGYVFVLEDNDIHEVSAICTVPHITDDSYRVSMTIDLAAFDLWECPAIFDLTTGYWNVVAILGQEFGCTFFMSSAFVASMPELWQRLQSIREDR